MDRIDNLELKRRTLTHLADLYKIREVRESNHLSSYITCRTRSFLDQKQTVEPTDQEVMLFALGYGLQDVLTPKEADITTIIKDNIIYSPDMIVDNRQNEIKTTRKSAKYHYMDDGLPVTWVDYMMGGCYIMETNEYDLIILYMMGNYSPPFPEIYAETIRFDKEELEVNWQKILTQKEVLDIALSIRTPPEPFKNCYDWECKYCRYGLVCQTLVRMDEVNKVTNSLMKDGALPSYSQSEVAQAQSEEDKKLWD